MAAIVFAMSPVLNQTNASADGNFTRPPLPLTGTIGHHLGKTDQHSSDAHVKVNPFCLPAKVTEATPIQLASGTEPSKVRLQPIGAAIGLQNIEHGPVEHSETPAITVEAPEASEVQSNPLIEQARQRSSIVLLPMKQAVIEVKQPEPLVDPSVVPVTTEDNVAEMMVAGPTVAEPEIAEPEIAEPMAVEQADSEPVCFSFSDDSEPTFKEPVTLEAPVTSEFEAQLARGTDDASNTAEEVQPLVLNEMPGAKPIESSFMESVGRPQSNHFVTETTEPVVGPVVTGPEATLHSRRYRPPVDVQPVPIAMERSSKNDSGTQVESVVVSAPSWTNESDTNKPVVTSLYMNRAQVRSLTVGAKLQSVKIGDKSVCQAFAAGPNQIKLIGTGNGTTRLVVYAKPTDGNSEPLTRSFDIHVKDAAEATSDPMIDRSDMLNQTIQQAFPDADVVVRKSGNELVVMGRCGSEAVAKKIVRLVRRTCLVPVKDELRVR
jgi:hypothetical protein